MSLIKCASRLSCGNSWCRNTPGVKFLLRQIAVPGSTNLFTCSVQQLLRTITSSRTNLHSLKKPKRYGRSNA